MALQAVVSATVWVAGGLRAMERAAARDILVRGVCRAHDLHHERERNDEDRDPQCRFNRNRAALPAPEAARRAAQTHRAGQPSSVTKRRHARYAITSEPGVRNSNVHSATAIRNLRQSSQHRLSAWIGHDSANNTSSLRMNNRRHRKGCTQNYVKHPPGGIDARIFVRTAGVPHIPQRRITAYDRWRADPSDVAAPAPMTPTTPVAA